MLDSQEAPAPVRKIDTRGSSLRAFAARGVVVNTLFDVGLSGLSLIRGFILAALLTRVDYGVWGVLAASVGLLSQLKVIGVGEKYIQQDEPDQELAFQRAFTVEMIVTALGVVPLVAALPVVAVVYGHWNIVPPGLLLLTMLFAYAFQAPIWVHYRRMNFVRQRVLMAVEPVVAFAVALALGIAGAGYWALAIGLAAGAWSGAIVAVATSPYPLRWRYQRDAFRPYISFSGPIFVATAGNVALANGAAIATNARLGLAGVGALALVNNIVAFTTRIDDLVSGTLYPAICAIQRQLDLLRETFIKVNRIALMWAMPFGCALAVFAQDLVRFGIGEKWRSAVVLLRILGVVAAVGHLGFNWDDYYRARAKTLPIAVATLAATVTFFAVGLPLLFVDGLTGLAIGIAAQTLVHIAFRGWYISKLFDGFAFVAHSIRAMLPTLPGIGVVLAARLLEQGPRTLAMVLAELAIYGVVVAAATWLVERRLISEAIGYLLDRQRREVPLENAV